MRIHLAGHLNWYDGENRVWFDLEVADQTRLVDLLAELGIPQGEVAVVSLNGQPVGLEGAVLMDADRLELFPPVSGG